MIYTTLWHDKGVHICYAFVCVCVYIDKVIVVIWREFISLLDTNKIYSTNFKLLHLTPKVWINMKSLGFHPKYPQQLYFNPNFNNN